MVAIEIVTAAEVFPLLDAMTADGLDVIAGEGIWLAARGRNGRIAGVARLFERDGHWVLDDVWVDPSRRRSGIATSLIEFAGTQRRPLWLISDEPDVAFYAARGFAEAGDAQFPDALAAHYRAKDEWPAPDHRHVAMRMA